MHVWEAKNVTDNVSNNTGFHHIRRMNIKCIKQWSQCGNIHTSKTNWGCFWYSMIFFKVLRAVVLQCAWIWFAKSQAILQTSSMSNSEFHGYI